MKNLNVIATHHATPVGHVAMFTQLADGSLSGVMVTVDDKEGVIAVSLPPPYINFWQDYVSPLIKDEPDGSES